jgi:hypothetical protein
VRPRLLSVKKAALLTVLSAACFPHWVRLNWQTAVSADLASATDPACLRRVATEMQGVTEVGPTKVDTIEQLNPVWRLQIRTGFGVKTAAGSGVVEQVQYNDSVTAVFLAYVIWGKDPAPELREEAAATLRDLFEHAVAVCELELRGRPRLLQR